MALSDAPAGSLSFDEFFDALTGSVGSVGALASVAAGVGVSGSVSAGDYISAASIILSSWETRVKSQVQMLTRNNPNYRFAIAGVDADGRLYFHTPLTLAGATSYLMAGAPWGANTRGVIALTHSDALRLTNALGGVAKTKGAQPHYLDVTRSNFLPHFHPAQNPNAHIWFFR